MLYLSAILIERKDIETFDDFLGAVREKAASGERFIRFDLKPPFPLSLIHISEPTRR